MSVPLAVFVKSAITFPLTFGVLDVPPAFAEDAVPDLGMMISGAFGVGALSAVLFPLPRRPPEPPEPPFHF